MRGRARAAELRLRRQTSEPCRAPTPRFRSSRRTPPSLSAPGGTLPSAAGTFQSPSTRSGLAVGQPACRSDRVAERRRACLDSRHGAGRAEGHPAVATSRRGGERSGRRPSKRCLDHRRGHGRQDTLSISISPSATARNADRSPRTAINGICRCSTSFAATAQPFGTSGVLSSRTCQPESGEEYRHNDLLDPRGTCSMSRRRGAAISSRG